MEYFEGEWSETGGGGRYGPPYDDEYRTEFSVFLVFKIPTSVSMSIFENIGYPVFQYTDPPLTHTCLGKKIIPVYGPVIFLFLAFLLDSCDRLT